MGIRIRTFIRETDKISKIATLIIWIALIRTICEPFRLQFYSPSDLTYNEIRPFLIGALISAIALFLMTVLSFYKKKKAIVAVCILTIVSMLVVKAIYLGN
jgi:hypothetical protein